MAPPLTILILSVLLLPSSTESSPPVLEQGYTITTVLDCNKLQVPIHPYSLQRVQSDGRSALIVMDSVGSSFFSLPLPTSQDGEIARFAGNGAAGYSDGGKEVSTFAHPRSFAVDSRGNVYVADRSSHVIRKISAEGSTTTIAGGYSRKAGKTDGPAQNASFSDDYEVVYIPEMCALLISDRGNSLIRQMNLKQEDCINKSQKGLRGTFVSVIAISCALVGFALGIVARPFLITSRTYRKLGMIWKRFLINLGPMSPTLYSVSKSAIAKSSGFYLIVYKTTGLVVSYLVSVFSVRRLESHPPGEILSLLDSDVVSDSTTVPSVDFVDQLKDMISFDEDLGSPEPPSYEEDSGKASRGGSVTKIDAMMMSNISNFDGHSLKQRRPNISSPGLVKRQGGVADLISG